MSTVTVGLYKSTSITYHLGPVPWVEWPEKPISPGLLAHALSLLNRFTGQTKAGHSVAEHSVMVRNLADSRYHSPLINRACLLHDAPEALGINDLHSRIKRELAPKVKELEELVSSGLWNQLGEAPWVPWGEVEKLLKPLDRAAGDFEFACHFNKGGVWPKDVAKHCTPRFWPPTVAESLWLSRWHLDGGA